ncbi:MAG: sarcosine oxidase subunit gamma [Alsobacter sp.]
MPEIARRPALPASGEPPPGVAVTLGALPPAARFVLRGDPAAVAAAGGAFGVALPQRINAASAQGARCAVMLGPDEWLLIADDAAAPGATAALARDLGGALGAVPHSLVDVSHRQTAIRVEGHEAELTLNAAVPLDLSDEAFPVGMATRTILEKAEIVLWRTGPKAFRVEVWRSFAPYVMDLLSAVAQENAPD